MTTSVVITNPETNTGDTDIAVALLDGNSQAQGSAALVIKRGQSQEFYVHSGQKLLVVEVQPTPANT